MLRSTLAQLLKALVHTLPAKFLNPPRDPCPLASAALSWVLMVAGPGQQAPVPFINETVLSETKCLHYAVDAVVLQVGAAQMYGNKILQKYRSEPGDDAKNHVAFVKGYIALLQGLAAYAKANHATGLSWKASGGDALAAFSSASGSGAPAPAPAPAAPTSSGPPPPGPPPPGPPPGFWKDEKAAAPAAPKSGTLGVHEQFMRFAARCG